MTIKAKGLDHVSIVVKDLDKAIEVYREMFGLELTAVEEVPEQKVRAAFFGRGMGRLELICPTVKDSGVARFLEKRGEGLHHICIEVEDIEVAMAVLKARGAPLVDEVPKPGAGGSKVAFIHPRGTSGVLTELREGPKRK
jgi:methylmalonyl-CoA epimerase